MSKLKNLDKDHTDKLYEALKKTVVRLCPKDRYCVLLIDESSVKPKQVPKEKVEGEKFPTHVINFMLRGVYGKWKLPISNVYWARQEADNGCVLGEAIVKIIFNVHSTGLCIIATVTDHSKLFTTAIDYLTENSVDKNCFKVGFNTVYHVYDPCRLLISVRNYFKKHNLVFEMGGQRREASWTHIIKTLEVDIERDERKLKKVTIFHVCPEILNKLTVSCCTQIFSETLAREIKRTVDLNQIPKEAQDTAELLLFFDVLFDSCNGTLPYAIQHKPYRCAISASNPHFKFWDQAEKILDSMRFVIPETKKVFRPEALDKWTYTLNSFRKISKTLKKFKIKYVPGRCFNLDALTNLMQILKAVNNDSSDIYCEETEGEILDQNILRMVLEEGEGYLEII